MSKFCASRCEKDIAGRDECIDAAAKAKEVFRDVFGTYTAKSVAEILAEVEFCPFRKLAELAKTAKSQYVQAQAACELAKYVRPTLRAVEHRFADDNITINLNF